MIALSLGLSHRPQASDRPTISYTPPVIDDDAAPGAVVSTLSVAGTPDGTGWSFALADDAGGRFALDGATLRVGATPLSHADTPRPALSVTATKAGQTLAATVEVNLRKALPALPLPTGARVMGMGHSFMARSAYTAVTAGSPLPTRIDIASGVICGDLGGLKLLDGRFNLDAWYDPAAANGGDSISFWGGAFAGVSGAHMPGVLERLPAYLARKPQVVVLDIGTNDINSGKEDDGVTPVTLSTLATRLERILSGLRDAGIWCVLLLPTARTDWPAGDPRHGLLEALSDHMRALDGRSGLKTVDDRAALAAVDGFGSGVLEDGVHLSSIGSWARLGALLPVLRSMVTAGDHYSRDYASPGNLSPLGGLLGTGGSKSGVTGAVATGLVATRGTGQADTIVATKEVISAGTAEKQVFTITPAGNANANRVCSLNLTWADMTFASIGVAPGDWIEASVDVELSESNDWLDALFQFDGYGASAIRQVVVGGMNVRQNGTQDGPKLSGPLACRLVLPAFEILGTDKIAEAPIRWRTSSRAFAVRWKKTSTDTLIVKVSPIIIRKVSDPRPAWGG